MKIAIVHYHAGHGGVAEVILALAIPKGKKMDLVVQKSVELGVSAIQPLVTRNTVTHEILAVEAVADRKGGAA